MSRYTEISHYRAPYKASFLGVGADDPNVAGQSSGADAAKAISVDSAGRAHWKDDYATLIRKLLPFQNAIFLSDRAVKLEPWSVQHLQAAAQDAAAASTLKASSAAAWLDQKLADKNVVFATLSVLYGTAEQDKQLIAIPVSEVETVKATSAMAPILAEPSAFLAMLATPFGMALGVVAVGGVAVAVFAKKKRKAA